LPFALIEYRPVQDRSGSALIAAAILRPISPAREFVASGE